MKAVEVIMENGVPEDRIIFINLVRPLLFSMTARIDGLYRQMWYFTDLLA